MGLTPSEMLVGGGLVVVAVAWLVWGDRWSKRGRAFVLASLSVLFLQGCVYGAMQFLTGPYSGPAADQQSFTSMVLGLPLTWYCARRALRLAPAGRFLVMPGALLIGLGIWGAIVGRGNYHLAVEAALVLWVFAIAFRVYRAAQSARVL